jgi:hypothetical protein
VIADVGSTVNYFNTLGTKTAANGGVLAAYTASA